jgi:hypothetical protein
METKTIPSPEQIIQRIEACELELKSLRRLLRVARDLETVDYAREIRKGPLPIAVTT